MQRSDPIVERFYKTKQWKQTRAAYITYKHGICERCTNSKHKDKSGFSPGKYVHHKIYITTKNIHDADITLNFNNLELLCYQCHQAEHFPKTIEYEFDENGDLISNE